MIEQNGKNAAEKAGAGGSAAERSNLTRSQFLIWMGQKLSADAPLYNMIQTFTFDGRLAPDRFARAFAALAEQSDALRTVIVEIDGTPQQQVLAEPPFQLEWIDLAGAPDPQAAYDAWVEERRGRLFDLGAGLYDTALLGLGENRFVWYLNQHHLITDGWSFEVVYRRVAALYQALGAGENPAALPPLPAYADYRRHEREHRHSPAFAADQSYWAEKIAEPVEPLPFYENASRASSPETERIVCDLGPERTRRLVALAGEEGIRTFSQDLTLFNLFASIFCAFLHRLSGREELMLGAPVHNRPTPAFKETIGLFMEVCPLRVAVDEAETFRSLVQKVTAESFATLRHARPGVSSAETNRSYPVLLNFVNVVFPPFCGLPVEVDWIHAGFGDTSHALRLQIHDFSGSGSYRLHFDLNRQLFNPVQQGRVVEHFLRVVDGILADPGRKLGELSLLSPDDEAVLVGNFNRTAAPVPAGESIVTLFEAQAARTPRAAAVVDNDRTLTYEQLDGRANRLAHHLRRLGIGPDTPVAIYMDHSLEVVAALLGVMKAGGAYVPIDPAFPVERVAWILSELGRSGSGAPPLILTQPPLAPALDHLEAAARVVVVDPEWTPFAGEGAGRLDDKPDPAHLAYVIYTSGSTGRPKGVMIEQRSLVNYIHWAIGRYLQGEVCDFPLFSSLSFDLTVTSIFVPLLSGGRIVVYPEDDGARGMAIFKVIKDNAVDFIKLTPAHLTLIQNLDLSRTRLKGFIVGGEDFKSELARRIDDQFAGRAAIYNEYGPTEATVGCMIHRFDRERDPATSVPIGRPIANTQIFVLDRSGQPVPPGVIGEMAVGGLGLARGYFNRPDLTAERFVEHPLAAGGRLYRTGDLARWSDDGRLEFLGRADHQVKIGGARIELGEIESRLLTHPAIREVVLEVTSVRRQPPAAPLRHCARCGLASNFPGVTYDEAGVCHICRAYDGYRERARSYFKSRAELDALLDRIKAERTGTHDCLVLLSGGKDSTYMLYQLAAAGLKILAFTLDNGYISETAKENIRRVVGALGVDHVFGTTPAMNEIFAESLRQHHNVCNGCFKTIYTLAVNLARERGIRTIVTGLSRGQFFETRLTEHVFQQPQFDPDRIDEAVLTARKAYHRRSDAVSHGLDVDVFRTDAVFEDIRFLDFYRYWEVDLAEMLDFLDRHAPWVRPADTGRSTNCLINDAGIYIHKKQQGYHNYALPYSWDVRLGHKTRDEALAELDDDIDEEQVRRILAEIGYEEPAPAAGLEEKRLAAYFVADRPLTTSDLRAYLGRDLPDFMIPTYFIPLEAMPLTRNGKVNREALPDPQERRPELATRFAPPEGPVESRVAAIWAGALHIPQIGRHDNFFELGGSSLPAIQIVYQVSQAFAVDFPLQAFFEEPTVAGMSGRIEGLILRQIESMSDEEAAELLNRL